MQQYNALDVRGVREHIVRTYSRYRISARGKQRGVARHRSGIAGNVYGLRDFIRGVWPELSDRCAWCYRTRLLAAAEFAAAQGFDAISTTLLISPYQDLDAIGAIGEEEGAAHGVRFHYENLRSGFAAHHRLARAHGLYMQRYCGCLYSEWEGLRGKQGGAR